MVLQSQDAIEGYSDQKKAGWYAVIGGFVMFVTHSFGNSARKPNVPARMERP